MNWAYFWLHSDGLGLLLALALLGLSVASWVVMGWKWRLLARVQRDLPRSLAAFWQAPHLSAAQAQLSVFDRDRCLLTLLQATQTGAGSTLAGAGPRHEQLTRSLRSALQTVLHRLHWGQTVLATAASSAPFVGLLGTVWGIFNALTGMAEAGQITVEKIAGPVGEALVMTALGLGVAIPALLGYNLQGKRIAQIETELEGFAHDLRALLSADTPSSAHTPGTDPRATDTLEADTP